MRRSWRPPVRSSSAWKASVAGPEGSEGSFRRPQFAKWQSFRQSEDSRYVALNRGPRSAAHALRSEENPVKSFAC
ncbi:type VI secretion system contractile sheath domain-containing protein [Pseudomonas aeruginosa]